MSSPSQSSSRSTFPRATTCLAVLSLMLVLCISLSPWSQPVSARQADGIVTVLWSTIGSGGVPDEQDINAQEVVFSGPVASIRSTVEAANVVLRYKQGTIPFSESNDLFLRVRYLDNGGSARVRVTVRQMNVDTGALANVMTFDSDAFPSEHGFQVRDLVKCNYSNDFDTFVYFVEAVLDKTALVGNPQVGCVQIIEYVCE